MTSTKDKADALTEVAERVALWNEFRTDNFQDNVVRRVNEARELWRGEDGDLPRRGSDSLFDALLGMADMADASPTAVRDACAEGLRAAAGARSGR